MTTKHTPGPWKVSDTISGRGYAIEMTGHNSDGEAKFSAMVEAPAYFVCGVSGTGRDECLANALLVAAAPELLEACQVLLGRLAAISHPDARWEDTGMTMARAAIAKATGGAK